MFQNSYLAVERHNPFMSQPNECSRKSQTGQWLVKEKNVTRELNAHLQNLTRQTLLRDWVG